VSGQLEGHRAVVTGAAGGIGGAIVAELQAHGATVLGLDVCVGGTAPIVVCDLADTASLDEVANSAVARLGGVDVLVNCAGIFREESVRDLSWAGYDHTLRVNLHAPVFLMSRLGQRMADQDYGRIVNVTSIHGRFSAPLSMAYDVSKAGLEAATRTFALELAQSGVLVNAIAPGFVETAMSLVEKENELDSEWFRSIYVTHGRLPLRRPAQPVEIARHVAFLCSGQNSYLTGQVVTVDGGLSARF
jgi:NAD(P)-dependent dehydrogenase (short-subunit alcohol dehydrogenase family)